MLVFNNITPKGRADTIDDFVSTPLHIGLFSAVVVKVHNYLLTSAGFEASLFFSTTISSLIFINFDALAYIEFDKIIKVPWIKLGLCI